MSVRKFIAVNEAIMKVYKSTPTLVGGLAVTFFKDRFVRGGWLDKSFQKWKPRKRNDNSAYARRAGNRALLVKTSRLKRSIRVMWKDNEKVVVGTDVPYAEAHNEGVNKSVNIKAHTRKRGNVSMNVKSHNRNISLPQRKFIGESDLLTRRIQMNIEKLIERELKKIK